MNSQWLDGRRFVACLCGWILEQNIYQMVSMRQSCCESLRGTKPKAIHSMAS